MPQIVAAVPTDDIHGYLSKYIEANRVHLFEIVTQYKAAHRDPFNNRSLSQAIFAHSLGDSSADQSMCLLNSWILQKARPVHASGAGHARLQIEAVLVVLEEKLPQLSDRLNSILGQTMVSGSVHRFRTDAAHQHLAISMGRIGIDFRAVMSPLFHQAARSMFQARIGHANQQFVKSFTPSSLYAHTPQSSFSNDAIGSPA